MTTAERVNKLSVNGDDHAIAGIVDAMPEGILILDHRDQETPLRILHSNRAMARSTGYPVSELLNQSVNLNFSNIDGPAGSADLIARTSRGETLELTADRRHRDGHLVSYEIRAVRFTWNGRSAILATFREVPKRRAADQSLHAVDAIHQTFMSNSPACAWITDDAGTITYASPNFERMVSVTNPCNKNVSELFPPSIAEEYLRNNRRVLDENKTIQTFERGPRAIGGEGIFLVFKFPIRGADGTLRVGGVAVDITDQKRAEAALGESDERLHLALAAARMAIWEWHPDGSMYWSDQIHEIVGVPAEMFAEKTAGAFKRFMYPEDRAEMWIRMQASIEQRSRFECEFRILLADGSLRWFTSSGQPLFDAEGRLLKTIGTITDITENKHAIEQEMQHRSVIAHLSRVGSMGEMASSFAHELNQPLTAILSYAGISSEIARAETGWSGAREIGEHLRELSAEARRAAEIIKRMRAFIRKQPPFRQSESINDVVIEAMALMKFELKAAGISAQLHLEPVLRRVLIDSVQIQQVLINLVQNGIDAMLDAAPSRRQIFVNTASIGREIRVSVRDFGSGIAADASPRIFETFYTTKPKGLGLGLPICRSIIESHRGSLSVASNTDVGMTFEFLLPAL